MKKILLTVFLFMLFSAKTPAHPHVWIETSLDLLVENKKITAINVKWVYDEFYSSAAFFESDIDGNNVISPEENLKFLDRTYEELKKNNFFTYLKLNKTQLSGFEIKNFDARFKDEILTVSFTILVTEPVDPAGKEFTASFYDKTYFIEIYFQENNPVSFQKTESCKHKLYEDMTETYYYGMVNPETIKVICE